MFLTETDRLIIMEVSAKPISIPDLLQLEKVGVETLLLTGWTYLNLPWEMFLDRIDTIVRETNMKILLELFYAPRHDWWLIPIEESSLSYRKYRHVNYESSKVGTSIDKCMVEILGQIDTTRTQLVFAGAAGGEFLWEDNNLPCPVPIEVLTEFMVNRQRICANLHGEVWTSHHHMLGGKLTTTTAINKALYQAFPIDEYDHYRIQSIQFSPPAMPAQEEFNKNAVQSNPKSKYFVGSEWVEGLVENYEKAMDHEVHGFLTCPMHNFTSYTKIEDWMLDYIGAAITKLKLEALRSARSMIR